VLRICNLSARRFLITFPNIGYWLSFVNLDVFRALRQVLERFCCEPDRRIEDRIAGADYVRMRAAVVAPVETAPPPESGVEGAVASLFWNAVTHPERAIGIEHLLLASLDARDAEGKPFATRDELAHPAEAVAMGLVVAPLVQRLAPVAAPISDELGIGRINELSREVSDLKTRVEQQQKTINELKRKK
jgi:hypothetical protein